MSTLSAAIKRRASAKTAASTPSGAGLPSAATTAVASALASPAGRAIYRRRKQMIEPVFAHWKHIRQITRVWRRGRTAVQAEIDLIATTHNLLKLYRAPTAA